MVGEIQREYYTPIETEKWMIERARVDPYFFIWYVTGMEPAFHHKIWLANFFHPTRNRINLIAARESAKTTELVYSQAWSMSKNPLSTNGMMSVSASQAEERLGMVRTLIRDNPRYRNVFPHIEIDENKPDTQTQFSIMNRAYSQREWVNKIATSRSELVKNPSYFSGSVGSKVMIGKRITGTLAWDDIMDDSYATAEAQDKLMTYLMKQIIPCVQIGARVWNIGTRWMVGDVYGRLKQNPAWHTIEIPAIYESDGKRYSYWPEFWPLWRLDERKDEMMNDREFAVMYLCDPYALSAGLFSEAMMKRGVPPTQVEDYRFIYIPNDHAISLQTAADFNVVYAVGITKSNEVHVLEGERWKSGMEDSVDRIATFADTIIAKYGRLTSILFENVGFQAAFMQMMINSRPDLPCAGVKIKGDKLHRANIAATWMNRNLLYINQAIPFFSTMVNEWIEFPASTHDDTLDPIGLFFQHINLKPFAAKKRKVSEEERKRRISFLR